MKLLYTNSVNKIDLFISSASHQRNFENNVSLFDFVFSLYKAFIKVNEFIKIFALCGRF